MVTASQAMTLVSRPTYPTVAEPSCSATLSSKFNKIYNVSCAEGFKFLPAKSINCIATSPPYYSLKFYDNAVCVWGGRHDCKHKFGEDNFCECGAWLGQLGLEPTKQLYITHLCDIFDDAKRVLKVGGGLWVNISDSRARVGGYKKKDEVDWNKKYGKRDYKCPHSNFFTRPSSKVRDIRRKSLMLIPTDFAREMVNRGWILRSTIIWQKTKAEPVKDRYYDNFEYIFWFVMDEKHYFNEKSKNRGCVWSIPPNRLSIKHSAMYPEKLAEIIIEDGCPLGGVVLDPFMGAGTTAIAAIKQGKNYIGFEINPQYVALANNRIKETFKELNRYFIPSSAQTMGVD